MALKEPTNMNEILYFTRRTIDEKGKIMAWVFKKECPECKKGIMEKPTEKGKTKIRAKEYICSECSHKETSDELEDSVKLNIKYTCPKCGYEGETQIPYKRKSYMGTKAFVFMCENCNEKIPITKKMKKIKKK